jgi:class 3 adenylate cyclase
MPFTFSIKPNAMEDRLEKLIADRLKPGADKKAVDERIWDLFGEIWCIMFTDLSGFSRNVAEFGIVHFLQTIYEAHRILVPIIEENNGILLKTEGDSFLVLFRSPLRALDCAVTMNQALFAYNKDKTDEEKVLLCLGVGYGPVLRIGDNDVFGAEVNAASKLGEDTAKAYEILLTGAVKEATEGLSTYRYEKINEIPPGASEAYKLLYLDR